jgi:riboflavin synthase
VFTGIVREIGTVEAVERVQGGSRLRVRASETAARSSIGDSIAVNGVCLTVAAGADGALVFDAVPETLRRSALGGLEVGDRVNIEPALAAGDPLGGHFVQGHVDALGRVRSLEPEGEGRRLVLDLPAEVALLCVEKGSIAIDGVSLTIAALSPQGVEIALVPHTLAVTTLVDLDPGDVVNVEADILAKHVERLLRARGSAA